MKDIRFNSYPAILLLSLVIFVCCSVPKTGLESPTYKHLKDYIDKIKVINTHEHQRLNPEFKKGNVNLFTILNSGYLKYDLVSAGLPGLDNDLIAQGDLDKLWDKYGSYLDYTRNTSYYGYLVDGFRILYGFNEPYFTGTNIKNLSVEIDRNYKDFDNWYRKAFRKASFELMLNDQHWDQFKADVDCKDYALVMRIDQFLSSVADRSRLEQTKTDTVNNPFYQAKKEGYEIWTLDDYLRFAEQWFKIFVENKAVAAKTHQAGRRTIYYEDVPEAEARQLFVKPSDSLTKMEKTRLEDFMFHWCVKKCIEYDLPLQIHTGFISGNRGTPDNGRPIKLNNIFLEYPQAKFILFHGGFPWYTEIGALAKTFPGVYVDIVWLPQVSREAAVDALRQWLDCVPYNKFFWGGDCYIIEGSAGSLEYIRDILAQVLAERVDRGLMTEDLARDVALKVFRENAIQVFKLEKKLGRHFD